MAKAVAESTVIKSDTDTAPAGAEFRGEYVTWGGKQKKVFVEKYENAKLVPLIDPHTKQPMYKRGAGGTVLNRVMTDRVVESIEEREFIQVDLGNGQVTKQYNFRESQEELDRRERQKRRDNALNELLDRIADEPGGIDALLDAADKAETPKKEETA